MGVDPSTNGFNPTHGYLRSEGNTLDTAGLGRFGTEFPFEFINQHYCMDYPECYGDWMACVDSNVDSDGDGAGDNWHSNVHANSGGSCSLEDGTSCGEGDLRDAVTSPNEPLFMLHHASIERNKQEWMRARGWDGDSVAWGYGGMSNPCYSIAGPNGFSGGLCNETVP